MGENTNIEWATHTLNPWIGCTKVSAGCDNCYAEALMDKRYGKVEWGPHGERKRTSAQTWNAVRRYEKKARETGTRPRIFCASLADVCDNQVPQQWREDLIDLIWDTPHLDWLLLTKRPENIRKLFVKMMPLLDTDDPWPHVWWGVTAEDQKAADRRIPILLDTPAAIRFVSYEPALGPVNFGYIAQGIHDVYPLIGRRTNDVSRDDCDLVRCGRLDWIIVGGESGPGARPAHPDWFRAVRDQCAVAGVAFLFKQWGEWLPGEVRLEGDSWHAYFQDGSGPDSHGGKPNHWWNGFETVPPYAPGVLCTRVGKKSAGRLLDGVEHNGFPATKAEARAA